MAGFGRPATHEREGETVSDGSDDWEDYATGPFCQHWGDGDHFCRNCGHRCGDHDGWNEIAGPCDVCECKTFQETEF